MEIHGVHEPRGPTDHTSNSRGWWDLEGWAGARSGQRCPVRGTDSPLPPSNSGGTHREGEQESTPGSRCRPAMPAAARPCALWTWHVPLALRQPHPPSCNLLYPFSPWPPLAALLLCPLLQPHGAALSLLSPCLHLFPDFRSHLPIKAPERAVSSLVRPPP